MNDWKTGENYTTHQSPVFTGGDPELSQVVIISLFHVQVALIVKSYSYDNYRILDLIISRAMMEVSGDGSGSSVPTGSMNRRMP